jgi:hypothetical protein
MEELLETVLLYGLPRVEGNKNHKLGETWQTIWNVQKKIILS